MRVEFFPIYSLTLYGTFLPMLLLIIPLLVSLLTKSYKDPKNPLILSLLGGLVLSLGSGYIIKQSTNPIFQKQIGDRIECTLNDNFSVKTINNILKRYNADSFDYDLESNKIVIYRYYDKKEDD